MEAEPLNLRALEIMKKVLGPEHPDTATSLNNLALLYYAQKRYTEAKPLFNQSLEILQNRLGAKHPTTIKVVQNYAGLLRDMNRNPEADELLSRFALPPDSGEPAKP